MYASFKVLMASNLLFPRDVQVLKGNVLWEQFVLNVFLRARPHWEVLQLTCSGLYSNLV